MNAISWNCRGLSSNSSPLHSFIKNLTTILALDFLFLSETKCNVSQLIPFVSRLGFKNFTGSDAEGSKGGLFLCWSDKLKVLVLHNSKNVIACSVIFPNGYECRVGFVYGSPVLDSRSIVWAEIQNLMNTQLADCVLIGDFNQVDSKHQKLGGNSKLLRAQDFINWKLNNNLFDIPYKGVSFTWTNNRQGNDLILERLDRGFCNLNWKDEFPDATITNLPIFLSDHSPILLQTHPIHTKKARPYKLESWCLQMEEIKNTMKRIWNLQIQGSSAFILQRKLEFFLQDARTFCLDFKKENTLDWQFFHHKAAYNQANIQTVTQGAQVMLESQKLREILQIKWEYWKQRSKSKWDTLGDSSTSFFFRSVKSRSIRNEIRMIKNDEEEWISNQSDLKQVFTKYFKDIFIPTQDRSPINSNDALFSNLPTLNDTHIEILNTPFSKEEIKAAAFSPKPFKSPGPDGFPPIFFQENWDSVGDNIYEIMQSFTSTNHLLKESNKTYICLIPKTKNPTSPSQFRPISLCNSSYKIISKTLVNRLKRIIGDLVGNFQNAFVPGRQLADNCLIAHEVLNWVKKQKKGTLFTGIMKVDLSKAYDRIRWDFVEAVLVKMNFPEKWIKWILQCISTDFSYSILINGEPTPFFNPKAGLRQGDPLSSYIFILCMEALSTTLTKAQETKDIHGIKIARSAPSLTHLFFADDALFFFKGIPKVCWKLKEILSDFCEKSGELINYEKSSLMFSPNTPRRFSSLMRKPLRMKTTNSLGTYLGSDPDINGAKLTKFAGLVEKVNNRIASWKFINLSPPGKLILINAILSALSSHILAIYKIPKAITKKIDSTLLRFWWSTNKEKKPIYWRKRTILEKHKFEGGLSLRNMEAANDSLLINQAWRIHHSKNSVIHRLYQAKYKTDPLTAGIKNRIPTTASYAFRSMCNATSKASSHFKHQVGDGTKTRIFEDWWVGDSKITHQQNSSNNLPQGAKVEDLILNGNWNATTVWNNFSREEARNILAINLPSTPLPDSFSWSQRKNGVYTARSGYWALLTINNSQIPRAIHDSFSYHLWHLNIFPKWKMFMWKIVNKVIPSAENLSKRKILVPTECHFCKTNYETTEHLFRDCQYSRKIWSTTMGIKSTSSPCIPLDRWVKNFMSLLKDRDKEEDSLGYCPGTSKFIGTLWAIWLHRNEIAFRTSNPNPNRIMSFFNEYMNRLQTFQKPNDRGSIQRLEEKNISWTKGKIKTKNITCVQVDGAWKKGKKDGSWEAAIAWKEEDSTTSFEARKVLAVSPIQTEAKALYECLKFWSNKTKAIFLKVDCRDLVKELIAKEGGNIKIRNLVSEIRRMANSFDFISCNYVSRNEVTNAHDLAVKARKSN